MNASLNALHNLIATNIPKPSETETQVPYLPQELSQDESFTDFNNWIEWALNASGEACRVLLEALTKLEDDSLNEIFSKHKIDFETVFNSPEDIPKDLISRWKKYHFYEDLANIIECDDNAQKLIAYKDQFKILNIDVSESDKKHLLPLNLLKLMISGSRLAIPLCKCTRYLSSPIRSELFKRIDDNGLNALMLAVGNCPEAVPSILDALKDCDEDTKKTVLTQISKNQGNALMFAASNYPEAVPSILDALKDCDEDTKKTVLTQISKNQGNALMFAASNYPKAVTSILDALKGCDENTKKTVLTQKSISDTNALMLAAINYPAAVLSILDALKDCDENTKKTVLTQKGKYDSWNALMYAANKYNYPEALLSILNALKNCDEDTKKTVLTQKSYDGWNTFSIIAQNQPQKMLPFLDIFKDCDENTINTSLNSKGYGYVLTDMIKSSNPKLNDDNLYFLIKILPRDDILVKDFDSIFERFFNEQNVIYKMCALRCFAKVHTDPSFSSLSSKIKVLLENYDKALVSNTGSNLSLDCIQEFENGLTQIISYMEFNRSELNYLNYSRTFSYRKISTLLMDLFSGLNEMRTNRIEWPDAEPYNSIKDKKSITDVLNILTSGKVESLDDESFPIFKQLFQQFPQEWKNKSLETYANDLQILNYQNLYKKLNQANIINELDNFYVETLPSAPPLSEAWLVTKANDNFNEILVEAQVISTHDDMTEKTLGISANDDAIQDTQNFWHEAEIKPDGLKEKLNGLLENPNDERSSEFIQFMRQPYLSLNLFDNSQAQRKKIMKHLYENKALLTRYHLIELSHQAEHFKQMAESIPPTVQSKKRNALINLALDLEALREGIFLCIKEIEGENDIDQKNRIVKSNNKFLNYYLTRFEQFKKEYPEMLNFKSSLTHPSGESMHTLESFLARPFKVPRVEISSNPLPSNKNATLLLTSIRDKSVNFKQKIIENRGISELFKCLDHNKKNILLLALETKDVEKIQAVADEIYSLADNDRKDILTTCSKKGYRLTSYIAQPSKTLYLLELERILFQLETNNPNDPNVKTFKNLLLILRSDDRSSIDVQEAIDAARNEVKHNSTWSQWLFKGYSSTGYGVGIFKERLDDFLVKLNDVIITEATWLRKPDAN